MTDDLGIARNRIARLTAPPGATFAKAAALAALLLAVSVPGWSQTSESSQYLVTGYSIRAQLFPSTHVLTATARINFTPEEQLLNLNFELNSVLKVERVTDAEGQDAQFHQDGLNLGITLPNVAPADQSTFITVLYGGALDSAAGSPVEGVNLAHVGSRGSYLFYSGDWFPVRPPGYDRFSATLKIKVPPDETVIASGVASAPEQSADGTTYTYTFDQPSFPGTVIAGPYKIVPSTVPGADVTFYLDPQDASYAESYGQATENLLEFFSSKFGSLPNGHLAIVEIGNDSVNGDSAPGLIVLAARAFTKPVDTRLLAHEISRQWWNALVSPATPNDAFLDQGLATYSSALYTQASKDEASYEERMHTIAIDALTHESAAPISQAAQLQPYTPDYDSIVFNKGAMIFHMLRWVIGDKPFFATLRAMASQYAWKTITVPDFQRLAEKASKKQLTYFFAQWVSSTGVPQFTRQWAIYRTQKGFEVVGKIHQDLDIFRMPVEIRVMQHGRPPVDDIVNMVGTSASFTVDTPTRPYKVAIDPGSDILKMDDRLKRDVLMARGEQLYQQQAYFDAISEYQKVVDLNRNDSLAHYRLGEIYFKLQNYNTSIQEFRDALNGNLSPKWIEVWSHLMLGEIFDATGNRDRALNEYQRALQTNDNTQGALTLADEYIKKPFQSKSREIS